MIKGRAFAHKVTSVQNFHTKSFRLLMENYQTASHHEELEDVLTETGVKEYLNA